jgi:hypothetical protein
MIESLYRQKIIRRLYIRLQQVIKITFFLQPKGLRYIIKNESESKRTQRMKNF